MRRTGLALTALLVAAVWVAARVPVDDIGRSRVVDPFGITGDPPSGRWYARGAVLYEG